MKKQLEIKITFSQYKENPSIYLGHAEWLKHKSPTFLKQYLRTYKKVLMDNIRILNSYNAQIYALYRTFYFDLPVSEVYSINKCNNDFNTSLNWIFDNIGGCQNSIIFKKMDSCISISLMMLDIMLKYAQTYKNYSLKNQSEAYIKMIENFEERYNADKRSLNLERSYSKTHLKIIPETLNDAI